MVLKPRGPPQKYPARSQEINKLWKINIPAQNLWPFEFRIKVSIKAFTSKRSMQAVRSTAGLATIYR